MTEKERSRRASWHCRADKKKRRPVREEGKGERRGRIKKDRNTRTEERDDGRKKI